MKTSKILLVGLIALAAVGCNKSVVPQVQAPSDSANNNQKVNLDQTFSKSYQSGYEGYFSTITYTVHFPAGLTVSNDKDNPAIINIDDAKDIRQSVIQIFNNDAAGFSSSKEFWEAMNKCPDCKASGKTLNLKDAKDVLTYEDSDTEWVVYQHDPGFVLVKVNKPVDLYEQILAALEIKVDKNTVHP